MTRPSRDQDLPLLPEADGIVPLFWPYVTDTMRNAVAEQMHTRWLGQGPRVDEFERRFASQVLMDRSGAVAVNSGTSALHLAYLLALDAYWPQSTKPLDGEVLCPIFTCTATNLPWLYIGLDIRWVDVDPHSMNMSLEALESAIGPRTRAISVVHYGGYPVDVASIRRIADPLGIAVIEDAAQGLGASVRGEPVGTLAPYGAFSFQAIKHITTGDGGMLTLSEPAQVSIAKRLRWFGIDREGKQNGTWENDIWELGYKYQMTDIAASMGVAGLEDLDIVLQHRRTLLKRYEENLAGRDGITLLTVPIHLQDQLIHAAWLATVVVASGRERIRSVLREHGVESNAVHFRNDRYSAFSNAKATEAPVMDALEDNYLCLPLHTNVSLDQVDRISDIVLKAI